MIQLQHILPFWTYMIASTGSLAHSCKVRASSLSKNTAASQAALLKATWVSPARKNISFSAWVRTLPWAQMNQGASLVSQLPHCPPLQLLISNWCRQLHTLLTSSTWRQWFPMQVYTLPWYNASRLFIRHCQQLSFANLQSMYPTTRATSHIPPAVPKHDVSYCSFVP